VSAPCTWEEIERAEVAPQHFTLRNMAARLAAVGDLWSELLHAGQALAQPAEQLRSLISPEELAAAIAAGTRRSAPRKAGAKTAKGSAGGDEA
jgi:hypothetical protein